MSGKGSKPRPFAVSQDEYADRFDAIFGKRSTGRSSTAEQGALTASVVGSSPTAPANCMGDYNGVPVYADGPEAAERLYQVQVYIDNETGAQVTEEWWPGDQINQEPTA